MNPQRSTFPLWMRHALAGLAGLLWAIAFPYWNVAGLGWIAPGLILLATSACAGKTAARIGYTAGVVHYLTGLYWLLHMPVAVFPVVGWLALALFLSLYPASWAWVCWRMYPGRQIERTDAQTGNNLVVRTRATTSLQRMGWALFCAAAWVTWEMIQSRLFTGFPWNLLGASQSRNLLVIQIASFTGVYGISFLMVWCAASLLSAGLLFVSHPEKKLSWQREVFLPFLAVLLLCGYGWTRLIAPVRAKQELQIALIQPSIPQTMIWDEGAAEKRVDKLLELSREALKRKPHLLVWPEATVPFPIQYDPSVRQAIRELLEGSSTWLVLGSDDVVLGESPDGESRTNFYNSAFLLNPSGEIVERYAKRQLVIFGEYIPLVRWLPFMKFFTPIGGGFTSGDRRVGFSLSGMDARFAPLICFEDMFSRVVRYQTQQDLDFLLNITNDGWFGESAQQWQHAASASFRAIENGLPLVRCSNNGITCWIDSQGRMSDPRVGPKATPYSEGIQHIVVPLSRTAAKEWTFYRRYGDVFGWGCVAAVGLMLLNSKRNVPGGDYH